MATRRERVVLELDDNFTSGMARAAAATALMKREMDNLNGSGRRIATDLDRADRSVTRLSADVERSGSQIDRYSGRLQALAEGAAILGPGLIPVAAGVAGLTAALSAPIAATGGGLTIYGILTGAAIKQTEEQKKKIQQLAQAVQSARTSLADANASAATSRANSVASAQRSASLSALSAQQSAQNAIASAKQSLDASLASAQKAMQTATTAAGRAAAQQRIDAAKTAYQQRIAAAQQSLADRKSLISKGLENSSATAAASATASQAAAQRKVNEAVQKYRLALHELTPAQKDFLNAQDDLKSAFQRFLTRNGSALLGPLTSGMRDAQHILPVVSPLMRDVGSALSYLLDEVDRSAQSGTLRDFLGLMDRAAGPAIVSFGEVLGNIGSGIEGLISASEPLSHSVLPALERLTGDFADFGQNADSNGFQDFLDYVRQEGPEAAHLLGELAGALAAVVEDAAPVGGIVLHGLTDLAEVLHTVADSPAGPVLFSTAAGLLAVNRAISIGQGIKGSEMLSFLKGEGTLAGMSRLQFGLAGLGIAMSTFASKAGDAGQGVSVLGDALAGASIGSAFGPWGTAIGGASGALIGLVSDIRQSDTVIGHSKPIVSDYAATFDRLTGAITRATRADVFQDLQKSGAIKAAQGLGLSAKTLTDAALGNVRAQRLVSQALANTRENVLLLQQAQRRDFANKTKYTEYQHQLESLMGAYNLVKGSVDDTSAAIKRQQQQARDARGALIDYVKTFDHFPKRAVTEIKADGLPQTMADVVDLANRYKLTPKEINTLVKVSGTGPAKQQIHEVQAELDKLHDRDINLTVIRHQGTGAGSQRGQSRAVFNAAGDIANAHAPMLATGGPIRVWAEPETRGEAYIPLADDWRRPRAVDIWERTGQALGVQFARFAGGGMTRTVTVSPQVSAGPGIDYGQLARALAAVRPLYGDVHLQPHDYNAFKREMLADQQRAGLGVSEP